ncbi:hypothetical protein ACFS5N_16225 [Mucilaginibacter ximonensis]|uniref:Killing trait domain-containing protein n=1 Tax=Mucilaginibacter ximonensis TaxID=538021 RepID=A0ABW5YFG8_9SPHI
MKKAILIIILVMIATVTFAQNKQESKVSEASQKPTFKNDTTSIKASVFADANLAGLYGAIETVKKGLPGSSTVSAAEASASLQVMDNLSKLIAIIYNERHPQAPAVNENNKNPKK